MKIQEGILQGDALKTLAFEIAMIPLTHILRKGTRGYKFTKSREKIDPQTYIDNIKLLAKMKKKQNKELEILIQTIKIYSQDIGMEFDLEKVPRW